MKTKFQNFNLGEVEVLTQAEQSRVKGGYFPTGVGSGGGSFGGGGSMAWVTCECNFQINGVPQDIAWQASISVWNCNRSESALACRSTAASSGNIPVGTLINACYAAKGCP